MVAACRDFAGGSYEIILVNDGSTDHTWPCIRATSLLQPGVIGVNLSRNHGHQMAVTAGLAQARGERVLVIDADLQDPPELLGDMMRRMDDGFDVVYGRRRARAGETLAKRGTAWALLPRARGAVGRRNSARHRRFPPDVAKDRRSP